ncbi:NUDIX domain-containing protein [Candidatus Thioglobus sp.]|nr:NUDIX domain-containing protein [Candidatus Thioglobus sp.]
MLDNQIFKTVVDSAPLVSIDILIKKDNKILLGRRVNKPAQSYFFSIGGRINKNETIVNAMVRVVLNELNIELKSVPKFIGIFEHFYDDSIYKDVSTHYVNLAYEYEVEETPDLPTEQHSEYQWFAVDELLNSDQVHKYTKDYFRN